MSNEPRRVATLGTPATALGLQISRRAFVFATSGAMLLPSCGVGTSTEPPPPPPPPPPPKVGDSFDKVRALRDWVRSSPDHLSARAAEIVATKDFARAVRFVREQIAVLPPVRQVDPTIDAVRWGSNATLRAGAGTQRERADLLAAMLTAMGASTRLVYAASPVGLDAATLYRSAPAAFVGDPLRLQALRDSFDEATLAKVTSGTDPDDQVLINSLLRLMPSAKALALQPFDGIGALVPVVEYRFGTETRWAFAMGAIDELATAPKTLGPELPAAKYPKVSARLLALAGDLPGAATPSGLIELVAGEWTTEQVAGRRLTIAFPAPNPATSAGLPPELLELRTPVISLLATPAAASTSQSQYALWRPRSEDAGGSFSGGAITLSGARFAATAKAADPLIGPYGTISQLDAAAHAAALSRVARLQVLANAGSFPDVHLTVAALDAAGQPVAGLVGGDFVVTDQGKNQVVSMLSNAPNDPKILLAYDCSVSVSWPTAADKARFEDALAQAFVASALATPFQVSVASLGNTPVNYTSPDASTIKAYLSSCIGGSRIWQTLGEIAVQAGASAVVVVSDFFIDDLPADIAALRRRFAASGIALALVPVSNTISQATLADIAAVSRGVTLDPQVPNFATRLNEFLTQAALRSRVSAYRLRYRLPLVEQEGGTQRVASVSSAAGVTASANYAVPAPAERGASGFAGLYIELEINGSKAIRRLSGPPINRVGGFDRVARQADFDETRGLLQSGVITVAFEPGSPTKAANLDDLLSSIDSYAVLSKYLGKPMRDAVASGRDISPYNTALSTLFDAYRAAQPLSLTVSPHNLRVAVMVESANDSGFARKIDVIPELNAAQTASSDAAASFRANLTAGVRLSLREAMAAKISAAGNLSNAKLQYVAPFETPASLAGFSAEALSQWRHLLEQFAAFHRLVPTTPEPGAMWVIDSDSGTAIAVLLDGSGGSRTNAVGNLGLQAALGLFGIYASIKGVLCSTPGATEFQCLGAYTATVLAGTGAAIAGGTLDTLSFADLILMILGALGSTLSGGASLVGAALTTAGVSVSLVEGAYSVHDKC